MDMLANIRQIGIFMIVAQTVIHFAAGQKYEKYLKIIAGVIILLQFITPFVSSSGDILSRCQEEVRIAMEQAERQSSMWQEEGYAFNHADSVALEKIEEEIKSRLNDVIAGREYYIDKLSIELEQTGRESVFETESGEDGWEFRCVRTVLRRAANDVAENQEGSQGQNIEHIEIEEIVVGEEKKEDAECDSMPDAAQDAVIQEYRQIFAQTLGIAEDRVEVAYGGE